MTHAISFARRRMTVIFGLLIAFSAGKAAAAETIIVVAADGSGQYKTVQEAIMVVPAGSSANPVIIRIKPGIYKELVYVQREKRFFHLLTLTFLECGGCKHRDDLQQDGSSPADLQVRKGAKRSAPPLKLHSHSTLISTTLW